MNKHEPTYLSQDQKEKLVKGQRVMIGNLGPFAVVSSPGEEEHPILSPPPEVVSWNPPYHKMYVDRRGV